MSYTGTVGLEIMPRVIGRKIVLVITLSDEGMHKIANVNIILKNHFLAVKNVVLVIEYQAFTIISVVISVCIFSPYTCATQNQDTDDWNHRMTGIIQRLCRQTYSPMCVCINHLC